MMNWDRDKLLMELPEFSFRRSAKPKGELARYHEFYGTDFCNQIKGLKQRIGWIDTKDFRIVVQNFVPSKAKATVFLFHGYFDHAGIYRHLIRFLVEHDFAVVIYDMPGHGLSSGKPTSISSFRQYQEAMDACIAKCDDNLPKPFHCVGQSTGGAVLIDRLVNTPKADVFDKVVLLAPLVRPKGWGGVKLIHSAVSPFLNVWHRTFSQNSNDIEFVKFLKDNDPLQSRWLAVDWITALKEWVANIEHAAPIQRKILIVQGTNDSTVDWKHNVSVLRHLFSETKIAYIENGRHHLVNESASKRAQVFEAVLSELAG